MELKLWLFKDNAKSGQCTFEYRGTLEGLHTHTHTHTLTHAHTHTHAHPGIEEYSDHPEGKCEYDEHEWAYGGPLPVHTLGDSIVEEVQYEVREKTEKKDCPKVCRSRSNHEYSTALEGGALL